MFVQHRLLWLYEGLYARHWRQVEDFSCLFEMKEELEISLDLNMLREILCMTKGREHVIIASRLTKFDEMHLNFPMLRLTV